MDPLIKSEWKLFAASGSRPSILTGSNFNELSNKIAQKGLAFGRERSGTAADRGHNACSRSCPAGLWPRWGFGGAASRRHQPNGGSRCQSLPRSDQALRRHRLSQQPNPHKRPLTIPRVTRVKGTSKNCRSCQIAKLLDVNRTESKRERTKNHSQGISGHLTSSDNFSRFPKESVANSKQARVIAMLRSPSGATIAAMVRRPAGNRTRCAAFWPAWSARS